MVRHGFGISPLECLLPNKQLKYSTQWSHGWESERSQRFDSFKAKEGMLRGGKDKRMDIWTLKILKLRRYEKSVKTRNLDQIKHNGT